MNGQLAALMALALHGNACLSTPDAPAPSLLEGNSTFQSVNALTIVDRRGRWRPQEIRFTDTAEWFEHLRDEKVARLSLLDAHAPSAEDAPVTAGERWALAGTTRRGRRSWGAAWDASAPDAPDQRVWSVRLAYDVTAGTTVLAAPGVNLATAALDHALEDIGTFASSHGLNNWRERFDDARYQLAADAPVLPYHPDIAPAGALSLPRTRLLAGAMMAWIFGGVGSWDDIGLDDLHGRSRMAQETRRLYETVIDAFLAVTNAT